MPRRRAWTSRRRRAPPRARPPARRSAWPPRSRGTPASRRAARRPSGGRALAVVADGSVVHDLHGGDALAKLLLLPKHLGLERGRGAFAEDIGALLTSAGLVSFGAASEPDASAAHSCLALPLAASSSPSQSSSSIGTRKSTRSSSGSTVPASSSSNTAPATYSRVSSSSPASIAAQCARASSTVGIASIVDASRSIGRVFRV